MKPQAPGSVLSEEELGRIDARVRNASKGPWESFIEKRDFRGGEDFIRIGGFDDNEADMIVLRSTTKGPRPASAADLDFIAAARQDIPRLVQEIRRLRGEIDRLAQAGPR